MASTPQHVVLSPTEWATTNPAWVPSTSQFLGIMFNCREAKDFQDAQAGYETALMHARFRYQEAFYAFFNPPSPQPLPDCAEISEEEFYNGKGKEPAKKKQRKN